jgi:membrane protease YdiL (CAAX protease family)
LSYNKDKLRPIKGDKMINKTVILKCFFVVFLVFIPSLFFSLTALLNNGQSVIVNYFNFNLGVRSALSWLMQSFQYGFPVLVLLFLTNESFADYGFNKISIKEWFKSLFRLLGLSILFSIILSIIVMLMMSFFKDFNYEDFYKLIGSRKNSIFAFSLNLIPIVLIAFTEELCFRSYLYINLNKIIKNKWICIMIVNLLFGICHIYQGLIGVIGTFFIGIIFSIEFKNHKNIYTISVFHALRNITTFILVTML